MKVSYFHIFRIGKIALFLFALILIFGCASTSQKVSNITPAELILSTPKGTTTVGLKPLSKSNSVKSEMLNLSPEERDIWKKLSEFKTFSVMPMLKFLTVTGGLNYETLDNAEKKLLDQFSFSDRGTENKILFELRNFLEAKGYLFVSIDKNPDVIFAIAGYVHKESVKVPTSSYSLPMWVPSKIINSLSTSSGNFSFNMLGEYSDYGWGFWSSSTTGTIRVPGHFKTETVTLPGYSVMDYYPNIVILGHKIVEDLPIFLSSAIGLSENPDFSVNAQFVLKSLIEDLSEGNYNHDKNTVKEKVGIEISILTNDGEDFFPTVMDVKEGSPAFQAGIKLYDMILAVNNKELSNESYSQVIKYLSLSADKVLNFSLWRIDKRIDVRVEPWK